MPDIICEKRRGRPKNPEGFQTGDRLYHIYKSMVVRCTKPNHPTYKNYGARGVKVCDEWLMNRRSFFIWAVANGYRDDLTIDRIDVNGDYCPENCRWVDWITQNNNRGSNRILTAHGVSHTLAEWSRITGLMPRTIANRIDCQGWSEERAIITPLDILHSQQAKGGRADGI